jgi:hypothetical protein
MSAVTRVKRPTYATPRKNPPGRYIHVSPKGSAPYRRPQAKVSP